MYIYMYISVSVKKSLLRKRTHVGMVAFRAPIQGLESSFCRWTAGYVYIYIYIYIYTKGGAKKGL